jgi:hypothetical protein
MSSNHALAVIAQAPDTQLDELAVTVNREHALALQSGVAMVRHAILAGEALAAAKEMCAPGTWGAWLDANFPAERSTATTYMRIAKYKEHVLRDLESPTLKDAIQYLRGLPRNEWLDHETRQRMADQTRRKAARRKEAANALQQRQREMGAKRIGGSVADGYSLVRRAVQAVDRAHSESRDREVRAALSHAIGRLHEAEDQIVRAMGLE